MQLPLLTARSRVLLGPLQCLSWSKNSPQALKTEGPSPDHKTSTTCRFPQLHSASSRHPILLNILILSFSSTPRFSKLFFSSFRFQWQICLFAFVFSPTHSSRSVHSNILYLNTQTLLCKQYKAYISSWRYFFQPSISSFFLMPQAHISPPGCPQNSQNKAHCLFNQYRW